MNKKLLTVIGLAVLGMGATSCATTDQTTNANANVAPTESTRTAADGTEVITTTTDASGVKTETRVFRNNPRISRVVVTTRDGRRTVRAYSPSGEEKEINDVGDALEVSGDKIADAARWTADKAEDVGDATIQGAKTVGEKTADGARTVGEKTADGARTVGEKTVDGARTVGEKTADGARTVGKKTAEGAKKTGKAIKDAIIP
ncbi:hypothetical protein BH18ACI4_BH18ACI4_14750 [soil metagenome]